MTDKSRACSFDKNAEIYDAVRPGYPQQMYADIKKYCMITEKSRLLEIGAGSGIATTEINNYFQANITAIEPGKNMFQICQNRFLNKTDVTVYNTDLEDFATNRAFDEVLSATAFHWPDPDQKYQICHKLLQSKGYLAVFWNNFSNDEQKIFTDIQKLYDKFLPDLHFNYGSGHDWRQNRIQQRQKEINESGYFNIIFSRQYNTKHIYSTENYIGLLKTYSTHAVQDGQTMKAFHSSIRQLLDSHGGFFHLPVLVNLEIAEKI